MLTNTEIIILSVSIVGVAIILAVAVGIVRHCSTQWRQRIIRQVEQRAERRRRTNGPRRNHASIRGRGSTRRRNRVTEFRHANIGSPSDSDSTPSPTSPDVDTPIATVIQIIQHDNESSGRTSNRTHQVVYPEQLYSPSGSGSYDLESGSDDNRVTSNEARRSVPFAENAL